jgi:hypothetical protein
MIASLWACGKWILRTTRASANENSMEFYERRAQPNFATAMQAGIAFTWAGLVAGLSFIETPLKFRAPGVTEVIAVGIGRLVFSTLNRIELILSVLLFWSLMRGNRDPVKCGVFVVIGAIVATQTFWLLPALDARAQLLFDGIPPAPSFHHILFVGIEALKVVALLVFGTVTVRRPRG